MERKVILLLAVIVAMISSSLVFGEENQGLVQKMRGWFGSKAAPKAQAQPVRRAAPKQEVASQPAPAIGSKNPQAAETARPKIKMTKAELLKEIKDSLDSEDEILGFITDLKKQKGSDGKSFYVYLTNGREVKLDDLDENSLDNILTRINQVEVKLRTDRIQQQMETIRRAQQVQNMVPAVPRVVTSPAARPPAAPSQPPRAPSQPPSAPSAPPSAPGRR